MARQRRIGLPTAEAIDDVWQRRATAAAIAAVRQVIDGDAIPKATPIGRLSAAMRLITTAMTARDLSSGVATNRKPLEQMQRIASAEAGGPLAAPGELDDGLPF
jgi:hypothetical protein